MALDRAVTYARLEARALGFTRLPKRLTFTDWVQWRITATVRDRGCTSWYRTASGRNTTSWPDFTFAYRWRTRRLDPAAYRAA